ncbi:MAG: gamma carbonic anhydrase family protein [Chloroflexi bacterium]|nr:gamma carbonic anhydrase family protein [Chloroflexota bacterium]
MIRVWRGIEPQIGAETFIADGAEIIGDATVGPYSSIWFNTIIRADLAPIRIGARTSVQDGCVLHVDPGVPLSVGDDVTVGHGVILHSSHIGNGCLIGMGAIILDAEVGKNCLVGAGALVPPRKIYQPNSLILGAPAKVVRELTEEELAEIVANKDEYVRLTAEYLAKT